MVLSTPNAPLTSEPHCSVKLILMLLFKGICFLFKIMDHVDKAGNITQLGLILLFSRNMENCHTRLDWNPAVCHLYQ